MSDEADEDRKREDRRQWLGDPIEHGGGYRPPRSGWVADLGCCGLELLAAVSAFAGLFVLSARFLIG